MDSVRNQARGNCNLDGILARKMTSHDQKADKVDQCSDGPGDGIGSVKRLQRMMRLKISVDPDDPEAAGTEQRYDHRHNPIAEAAKFAAEDIHDPAQTVGSHDNLHTEDTVMYHGIFRSIETEQLIAEKVKGVPHDQSDGGHKCKAGKQDTV